MPERGINQEEQSLSNPYLRLWREVVCLAMYDVAKTIPPIGSVTPNSINKHEIKLREQQEAERWFWSGGPDFKETCLLAGFDPQAVRSKAFELMEMRANGGVDPQIISLLSQRGQGVGTSGTELAERRLKLKRRTDRYEDFVKRAAKKLGMDWSFVLSNRRGYDQDMSRAALYYYLWRRLSYEHKLLNQGEIGVIVNKSRRTIGWARDKHERNLSDQSYRDNLKILKEMDNEIRDLAKDQE